MEKRIFSRFSELNKWKDYINFKSFECKASLITSLTFLTFFLFMDIYKNFSEYLSPLQNITSGIFQSLIGMLGIILAGMAIIISLLNKELNNAITRVNNRNSIQSVLVSFEFLAFNIGIGVFLFLFLNLTLYSNKPLLSSSLFYSIVVISVYFVSFVIFYTISLIGNCIRVFFINDLYNESMYKQRSVLEEANEFRADYLILYLSKQIDLSSDELVEDLSQMVEKSNSHHKNELKEYFRNYYL